ncbi:unnamed protein product [Polarella glacialis]|uniref:WWE domain-containing protein n=1 Tax=Polarella glacialis TaxID=89957 RepID=A0A813FFR2_POLGL|nr:unnamed protein product [Polarella glacialis]CAE8733527.1 unnamed protein product [Polarella glacialis]
MGAGCAKGSAKVAVESLEGASSSVTSVEAETHSVEGEEVCQIPVFFEEILSELEQYQKQLGGLHHFKTKPHIERKVKKEEFTSAYSDYEYVYLTVLALAHLHVHSTEIILKNNGEIFTRNPGVQLLERVTGLTMHANRDGADNILRTAPACLVNCFQLAKLESGGGGTLRFFKQAFDRTADPCLEGRTGRLLEYLEKVRAKSNPQLAAAAPPWEDVSLQPLPKNSLPRDIIAEHLRIFVAECTWRLSQDRCLDYEEAKCLRWSQTHAEEFARMFNADTFRCWMQARGVIANPLAKQWECLAQDFAWHPYQPECSLQIERARQEGLKELSIKLGPKGWCYLVDFEKMVQRNAKTGQERSMRCVDAAVAERNGKLWPSDLTEGIAYFVELETLPPAPTTEVREQPPAGSNAKPVSGGDEVALPHPCVDQCRPGDAEGGGGAKPSSLLPDFSEGEESLARGVAGSIDSGTVAMQHESVPSGEGEASSSKSAVRLFLTKQVDSFDRLHQISAAGESNEEQEAKASLDYSSSHGQDVPETLCAVASTRDSAICDEMPRGSGREEATSRDNEFILEPQRVDEIRVDLIEGSRPSEVLLVEAVTAGHPALQPSLTEGDDRRSANPALA